MGDGWIRNTFHNNPCLVVASITEEYLHELDRVFGVMSCGVSEFMSAEESANSTRDSGLSPDADARDYSDVYKWRSRNSTEFDSFAEWYSNGEKCWPEDLNLTPTVLKHWYCCDGTLVSEKCISIGASNEFASQSKVESYFESSGLPKPRNWNESNGSLVWNRTDSQILFDYMGDPLPGFSYKWPKR